MLIRQAQKKMVYNVSMLKEIAHQEPAWEIARRFPNQGSWTFQDYLGLAVFGQDEVATSRLLDGFTVAVNQVFAE